MKAMILAAGLGTRLRPLTEKTPKPLLPLTDRPLIDVLIGNLIRSGCEAVVINTHHLASIIDDFIREKSYGIPVHTVYEPRLLDTGGAIKNVEDFWDDRPFLVINGDIFTDMDLKGLYAVHLKDKPWVTMALHNHRDFNNVWVDAAGRIRGFGVRRPCPADSAGLESPPVDGSDGNSGFRILAFTGIQVIDPRVLDLIPADQPVGIIDVYCGMIRRGLAVKACLHPARYWYDIGTLDGYHQAVLEGLVRQVFEQDTPADDAHITWSSLKGDGSDRTWRRAACRGATLVVADHGPSPDQGTCEADAFVGIGRHLRKQGVKVPRIYEYHRPLGLVVLEDLGDTHLQDVVSRERDTGRIADHYHRVIDALVFMAILGAKGFDPALTYQTPSYDRDLILQSEARYFCDAFLN
ncbi:MAG: NTP transferase domain-containing protein, partial [Deltaproteobacteria bacterium]|nr:NTP transferase domain-containing protein [Deltaproteobacteria bacterium]